MRTLEITRQRVCGNVYKKGKRRRKYSPNSESIQILPKHWRDMTDEQVIEKAQRIVDKNKITSWDVLCANYRGIRSEFVKRDLPREALNFYEESKELVKWHKLDDPKFINYVKGRINGLKCWETFKSRFIGFTAEVYRRNLPREALGLN